MIVPVIFLLGDKEVGARFTCPKGVRFMDSLPKSPLGKFLRKELRARA